MVVIGSAALTATISCSLPPSASADVNSDQAQVAQLESRIALDGALVQHLVVSYDQAQAHEAALGAQVDAARAHLEADRRVEARASGVLRQLALTSYMTGAADNSTLTLFATGSMTQLAAQQQYTKVATEGLTNAIDAVEVDVQHSQTAEAQLLSAQSEAEASVQQLTGARQAAEVALVRDALCSVTSKATCRHCLRRQLDSARLPKRRRRRPWPAQAAAVAQAAAAAQAAAGRRRPPSREGDGQSLTGLLRQPTPSDQRPYTRKDRSGS